MAYEPRMASALSGASVSRLAYWRNGPKRILVPEVSAGGPILYSFRDLIALRTFVYLRERRPLQTIRRALNNLREIGEVDHLSRYKLVEQGRKSIALIQEDGEGAVDLVEQPGQQLTVIKLDDVLKSFPLGDIEVPDLAHPRKLISISPSIRGGRPVISGTRVSYDLIAGLVRDGVPPGEIKEYYPGVNAASARDAASFADYVDLVTRQKAA